MAFQTMRRGKRNVPEFEPPPSKVIEQVHNEDQSDLEKELGDLKIILFSTFQKLGKNYVHEINFSKYSQVQLIKSNSFECLNLYSILFPPSLKIILPNALKGCNFLDNIVFLKDDRNQNFLSIICDYAFNDTLIQTITIPENINELGSFCFPNCLKTILFENGAQKLNKIGKNAFSQTQIENFYIPSNISPFVEAKNVFYKCKKLNTLIFDHFINCDEQLHSIYFEDEKNVKEKRIKRKAEFFENIKKGEISDKPIEITQDFAISLMLSQTKIEKLEIFVSNINYFYFFNTPKLISITVKKSDNAKFIKINGLLYTKDEKKLIVAERNIVNAIISSKCQIITNYALNVPSLKKIDFENKSELQEISFLAFYESQIASLNIPATVNFIDYAAFYKCTKLETINIPNSIFLIDFFTFSHTKLTKITIPKSVIKLRYGCFCNCSNLKYVLFEKNSDLIEIDDYAFALTNIEKISIPKKVIRIGNCCFLHCNNLKFITFENISSISKIGSQCFYGTKIAESQLNKVIQKVDFSIIKWRNNFKNKSTISSLINPLILSKITQIFIPPSVEEIGFHAFFDYPSLTKVKINDITHSKLIRISNGAFYNCTSLTEFDIPKTINYFGDFSFKNCNNLSIKINVCSNENIFIGKSAFENSEIISFKVECKNMKINDFAFKNCNTLIEFDVKATNTTIIGKYCFVNCCSLAKVILNPETRKIIFKEGCFMNSFIDEFEFPTNLKIIPMNCFKKCINLSKVEINKNSKITQFGKEAFSKSCIKKIFIPPLTKIIDQNCFEKCKKLTEVDFSNFLYNCILYENAFCMSSIKQLNIPKGVKQIKGGCFENCEALQNITFSEDSAITKIEYNTFKSTGIQSLIIPSSISFIDEFSFENCINLQNVEFLRKNLQIASYAFKGCNQLINVKINSIIQIKSTFWSDIHNESLIITLKQEEIDDQVIDAFFKNNEPAFQSFQIINSVYFKRPFSFKSRFFSQIIQYKEGIYYSLDKKEIIFSDCLNKSLIIPKEVEIIRSKAFLFTKLKKIDFENNSNLLVIEDSVFQNLLIEEFSIPDSVKIIGKCAFYCCKKLKKVIISQNSQLEIIDEHAFEKSGITSILFPSKLKDINQYAFYECINLKKVDNYSNKINFGPKSFARSSIENIQFPPHSVFFSCCFEECKKLQRLKFIQKPTKLIFANNSFSFSGLKKIKIENAAVLDNAFNFCEQLKSVHIICKKDKIMQNSINYSNIEMFSLDLKLDNYKFFNEQKYFSAIINYVLSNNIDKFNFNVTFSRNNSINYNIYVNHKNIVVNNELIHINMIDNVEIFTENSPRKIKKNEILHVSSNVKKMNFQVMSHIKLIQWSKNCIVEDLGPPGLFSYYNLIEITIPKNVQKISPHLFEHCHFLRVVLFEKDSSLTELGEFAFSNTNIEKVDIPSSVRIIKQNAFSYNLKLKEVTFDGEIIENEAFYKTGLESFNLSNKTKIIGSKSFQYCRLLKQFNVDIKNSMLTEIGPNAFSEAGIKNINIPPNVETINEFTFCGCKNLENVTISDNSCLKTIGEYSFSGNLSLKYINIPKTITNLSYKAFINTPSLISIMNESNNLFNVMENKVVYSIDRSLVFVPRNLTDFVVARGCLIIHSGTFCGPNLESVTFSDDSLLCIEECGFSHSTKLKQINIPISVLKIGDEAFINCQNLETVNFNLACKLIEIPKFCFAFSGLKYINLPKSIIILNQSSFYFCKNLEQINLSNTNVRYIGYSAFSETNIQKVAFPASIQFVENHAFEGIKSLEIVDFTNSTEIICLNEQNIDEIKQFKKFMNKSNNELNEKMKELIEKKSQHDNINNQVVHSTVAQKKEALIKKPSFEQKLNSSAKNIKIVMKTPNNFNGSTNHISLSNPEITCFVQETAFSKSSVKKFIFNLKEFEWFRFFEKAIKIDEFIVNPNIHLHLAKLYKEIPHDNLLGRLYKAEKIEWKNQDSIVNKISKSIISPLNFLNTSKLTKIYLGDNIEVDSIPQCCFSFTALKEIYIPSSLITIKKSAFSQSYNLEKISFSTKSKLDKIDDFAFYECINLKSILIPNSVDTIPFKCFFFSGLERIELPPSIKIVGAMSFSNCKKLKNVVLNEGIVELGEFSFANNHLLETIKIPDSLKTIKNNAFFNCTKLKILETTSKTNLIEIYDGSIEYTLIEELKISHKAKILFEPRNVPKLNKISFYDKKPLNLVAFNDGTIYEKDEDLSIYARIRDLDELIKEINEFNFDNYQICDLENIILNIIMKLSQQNNKKNFFKINFFAPKNLNYLKINEMCNSTTISVLNDMNNLTTIEYIKEIVNIIDKFKNNNTVKHVKIFGNYAFLNSHSFVNLNLLETVEFSEWTNLFFIPKFAFNSCKKLKRITIPYSCLSIEEGAFKDCIDLQNVEFNGISHTTKIKNGLKIIGKHAFYGCKSLEKIVIPSTIEKICEGAFMKCEKLKQIEIGSITRYSEISNEKEQLKIIDKNAFRDCVLLDSFRVPQNCSIIGSMAFMNCKNLKTFICEGNTLTKISYRMFFNCSSLTSFTLKDLSFRNFDEETDQNIDTSMIPFSIESESFMNCSSLNKIIIEDKSKNVEIKQRLFGKHHMNIDPFKKWEKIKDRFRQTIKRRAFCNCTSLTKARFFFANLERIHEDAFLNCSSLMKIQFNSRYWIFLTSVNFDEKSFVGCPLDLKMYLFNNNKVVNSFENFVKNEIKERGIKTFIGHRSCLNTEFLLWNLNENEEKEKNKK